MDANPVFENRTAFVTRSVEQQEFRLRPDPEVNEVIKYLFMVVAARYGLLPHCISALSNHLHSILTDPKANFPKFLGEFHGLVALCVNSIYGDSGRLWDGKQTNRLYLDDNETLKREIGYTMANPTAAGLVEKGKEWEGVRACWPVREEVIRRPKFFRHKGSPVRQRKGQRNRKPTVREVDAMKETWEAEGVEFPPYVVFRLERPPGFEDVKEKTLKTDLKKVISDAEALARKERYDAGKRGYLGAELVRKTPRRTRSKKLHKRFSFIPKVVNRNREERLEALQRLRWWREAHTDAFAWWPTDPNVEFPIGTYQHRVYHGANVSATAPPGF